jgi:hypothetical protein
MAMNVAAGGSPFDNVQVEFGNLEPFGTFLVAALSGFSIDRVPFVCDRMALLVLTLTALGSYRAWSAANPGEDVDVMRWRGVLLGSATLGLSSLALAPDPPISHFCSADFVFKHNHALAFGLVGLLSRWPFTKRSSLQLGAVQGLLIWAFILDWAYLWPGLLLAAALKSDGMKVFQRAALGTALGLLAGVPYLLHFLRGYNPAGAGEMPQIWRDQIGGCLARPYLWSLDLGPAPPFCPGAGPGVAIRQRKRRALLPADGPVRGPGLWRRPSVWLRAFLVSPVAGSSWCGRIRRRIVHRETPRKPTSWLRWTR